MSEPLSTAHVEVPHVISSECGHPALATRTAPTSWAPKGELRYLPCPICRAVDLERKLAIVAMHATGRCHCKKADDCHDLIREAAEGEPIGNGQIRLDAIQECLDTIARTSLQWTSRSESRYFAHTEAADTIRTEVAKLKEIE